MWDPEPWLQLQLLALRKNGLHNYYKRNATITNFFTTFLQTIEVANFYWFASGSTIYITFLLTNNH